jgi:rod shape-determining protein MreD
MTAVISIPILGLISILQSAVVSRLPLNRGTADLVLVVLVALALQKSVKDAWQWSVVGGMFIDFFSGLPFGVFTVSYLSATAVAGFLRNRIWRFSFLMQLLVVLIGTLVTHAITIIILFVQGGLLELGTILRVITLPSIILNFMLSVPVFIIIQDIIQQITPEE